MALRALTLSPYRKRLVSLAKAKAYLGVTGSSQDTTILRLLAAIANSFETYLGFPLIRQRYEQTSAGSGRPIWILSVRPLDRSTLSVVIPATLYSDETVLDIAAGDYAVSDASQGLLIHRFAWPCSRNFVATYSAGYVPDEELVDWSAALAVTAGAWIRPSASSGCPFLLEVATSGDTGGSEPDWSAVAPGDAVTDGTAVLTVREAEELPDLLTEAALVELAACWGENGSGITSRPDDLQLERDGPVELQYAQAGSPALLSALQSRFARSVLGSFR